MKIKRGKWLLVAVALCMAIGMFASCAVSDNTGSSGGGNTNVTLVDFTDSADSASVGDAYEVKNPAVKDDSGNEYIPEVVVKDTEGNVIPTIGGNIEIRNVNGYVIEYTIKIGDKTFTKRITISVSDTDKPVINIASPEAAYVNEEYALPAVTVRDNAENPVTTEIKLYFVDGETKTEIAIENGKFTPAQKGTYEYYVKATDAAGNFAEKSVTFSAVTKLGHFVLADFADNADNATTAKRFAQNNAEVGWVETFEGASGVSWTIGGTQEYKNFSYRFGVSEAEMKAYEDEGWDYYSVRLYIDQEGSFRVLSWNADYVNENGVNTSVAPVTGKQWVTVYLAKSTITDAGIQSYWQNVDEPYGGGETGLKAFNTAPLRENGSVLFWINNLNDDTKIYVDEIRLEKGANLTLSGIDERVVKGETVSFTVNNPFDLEYEIAITHNGEKVALGSDGHSFVAAETGEYKIKLINKSAGYVGGYETTINILPAYTLSADDIADTVVGATITVPAVTVKNEKTNANIENPVINLSVSINGDVAISLSDYSLDIAEAGEYTIVYEYVDENGVSYTLTKTFSVTITVSDRYFTSFEDASLFENVTADAGSSIVQSTEQRVSGLYSAKVALAAKAAAKINFASPVKQKALQIAFKTYYDGASSNFQFRISTGAYTLNGVDVAEKAGSNNNKFAVALKTGWNYQLITIPESSEKMVTVNDILYGGITSFEFYFKNAVTFYIDDIEFISSDISFEDDAQHSTLCDGHVTAAKSDKYAHSGKYSAKFAYENKDGSVSILHANAPYAVTSGATKIGFWLYNDGKAAAISFGCASASYYAFDVCNQSFVAETGWGYYEFKMEGTFASVLQLNLWSSGALNQSFYMDDVNFIVEEKTADITFETDDEHSTTWDENNPWAVKSDAYAHSGRYSAKFAYENKNGLISIFHANAPYAVTSGATKIGFWLYNDGAAAAISFSCSASSFFASDVCNSAFVAESGWKYYEFGMATTPASVVQFALWSNSVLNQSFYMDDVSFIVEEKAADITFENDEDHSSEWKEAFPLNAIKSDEQAHDGKYSAKFVFTGAAGELVTILHAAPARSPWLLSAGCTKIGVWFYSSTGTDEAMNSLLFSAASGSFGAYDVFLNVQINLKEGWNYVEVPVSAGATQIIQFSLYTIGGTSAVYMDSVTFIA